MHELVATPPHCNGVKLSNSFFDRGPPAPLLSPCDFLGEAGQISRWEKSLNILGWTAFRPLKEPQSRAHILVLIHTGAVGFWGCMGLWRWDFRAQWLLGHDLDNRGCVGVISAPEQHLLLVRPMYSPLLYAVVMMFSQSLFWHKRHQKTLFCSWNCITITSLTGGQSFFFKFKFVYFWVLRCLQIFNSFFLFRMSIIPILFTLSWSWSKV